MKSDHFRLFSFTTPHSLLNICRRASRGTWERAAGVEDGPNRVLKDVVDAEKGSSFKMRSSAHSQTEYD